MMPEALAEYYYKNYDRWFRHVRQPRKRCWPPYPVLNIPNDTDAEVAVQSAAGTVFLHADQFTEANRDLFIKRALDWEVGAYWRRRRGAGPLTDQLPAAPLPPPSLDQPHLEDRLTRALMQAREAMTMAERCAFGAYWKAKGNRPRATIIFHAAESESADYDGALNRARRKVKRALLAEFSPKATCVPSAASPLDEWAAILEEAGTELLTQVGWERLYELIYDIFCRDLPEVP